MARTRSIGTNAPHGRFLAPFSGKSPHGWEALAALFILSLALRALAMVFVPLIPEEAYYWMYAQNPDLSYYDHPPMVAWTIGLGGAIFGHNEFGVRVIGELLMVGASLLLYSFASMWVSRAAAFCSALLLHVLPVYFATGFIATMDSALLFFWALCLVGVGAALRRNQPWGWYVAGLALGGGMLSKYTGVFLAAGAVLAVLAHAPWRRHLRTIHPYLGLLMALALFSPVIVWNARHDWASFRFQFLDRFGNEPISARPVLIFLLYQFAVLTPLALWGCAAIAGRVARRPRRMLAPRWLFAACFSLPLLAVMAHKSLRYEIHINWTLPLYLSLFPAMSQLALVRLRRLRSGAAAPRWRRFVARSLAVCVAVNLGLTTYLLALQPRLQWISAFGPWQRLAAIVEEHEDRLEEERGTEPLIVAEGKYRLASVLAFYRTPVEEQVASSDFTTSQWIFGGRGLAYPYWADAARWSGGDCIYVVDDEDDRHLEMLSRHFESVERVDDHRLTRLGSRSYRLVVCKGFRSDPDLN